jgi:cell pole-organizing protein PopZ
MAQAAKSHEPSMEEILASIRRIIAEDDTDKLAQRPAEAASAEIGTEAIDSSLGAPRSMREPPSQETMSNSSPDASAGRTSTILDMTEATQAPSRTAAFEPMPPMPAASIERPVLEETPPGDDAGAARADERGRLVSSATSAAVDSAFNALAQTILVHNARTLEDLVREMLRPMLKVWLDDNLPGMVERLVRAEIERVSRGR